MVRDSDFDLAATSKKIDEQFVDDYMVSGATLESVGALRGVSAPRVCQRLHRWLGRNGGDKRAAVLVTKLGRTRYG